MLQTCSEAAVSVRARLLQADAAQGAPVVIPIGPTTFGDAGSSTGVSRLYSLVRLQVKNAHMASVASGPRGSVKEPDTDPPDHA